MPTPETNPAAPRDVEDLEERLSRPTPEVVADLAAVDGDIMLLGVGGKMGPTLARMARRAAPDRRILAVARFSDPAVATALEAQGVEPIRADLLDRAAIARLPRVPNVILMAGHKFGTSDAPSRTWATNTVLPGFVAEAMAESRIVAFSTGNVYPFVPVGSGGATEDEPLLPAPGDYAASCLGPRAGAALVLRDARHAGPDLPAQLRDRPALRRAARRRRARCATASPST